MRKILLCTLALLAGCASDDVLLRPLPPVTEPSTEVTMIRPRSIIQDERPLYVVVAEQPVFVLRNGEHARRRLSPGRQPLAIRCLGGPLAKPLELRIDQALPPGGQAYFIVEPKGDCLTVKSVSANEAASDLKTTRFRAVGQTNRMAQATGEAPAVFTTVPATAVATTAASGASPNQRVAAATAAWVEAFNSRDVARIASLYDTDAVLRDASGQRIAAGPGAIAEHFRNVKAPAAASLGDQEIRVFGDTAVASGSSALGRHNIVYRNRDGKWLIVDQSISAAK